MRVVDPREPLFGQTFRLVKAETQRLLVSSPALGTISVPRRATNLSPLVADTPRAKLTRVSVLEFLSLVKEYESCPPAPQPCGRASREATS